MTRLLRSASPRVTIATTLAATALASIAFMTTAAAAAPATGPVRPLDPPVRFDVPEDPDAYLDEALFMSRESPFFGYGLIGSDASVAQVLASGGGSSLWLDLRVDGSISLMTEWLEDEDLVGGLMLEGSLSYPVSLDGSGGAVYGDIGLGFTSVDPNSGKSLASGIRLVIPGGGTPYPTLAGSTCSKDGLCVVTRLGLVLSNPLVSVLSLGVRARFGLRQAGD